MFEVARHFRWRTAELHDPCLTGGHERLRGRRLTDVYRRVGHDGRIVVPRMEVGLLRRRRAVDLRVKVGVVTWSVIPQVDTLVRLVRELLHLVWVLFQRSGRSVVVG